MSDTSDVEMPSNAEPQDWLGLALSAAADRNDGRAESVDTERRQLLVIGLDGSDYAIEVACVREVVRMRPLTSVPHTPDWILGVIALRGEVVQVVDLRRRLGLATVPSNRASRIIVLHGEGDRVCGVLVDSVSEVFRAAEDELLPASDLELSVVTELCQRGGGFISILDVEKVAGFDDV